MWLIEDTRQQAGKHKVKHQWWTAHGDEVIRCKLPFGDYALPPEVSVDTKQDLTEIASNMCGTYNEKRRFREECKFAQTCGCELYFLIETDQVKEVDDLFGKRVRLGSGKFITGDQLAIAMHTMRERYGCIFMFCTKEEAASTIKTLLTWKKKT